MGKPNSGVFLAGIRIPWNAPPTLRVVKRTLEIRKVYPGPETKSKFALENRPKLPQKEKLHLSTIHFQVRTVSFRECNDMFL